MIHNLNYHFKLLVNFGKWPTYKEFSEKVNIIIRQLWKIYYLPEVRWSLLRNKSPVSSNYLLNCLKLKIKKDDFETLLWNCSEGIDFSFQSTTKEMFWEYFPSPQ